MVLRGDVAQGGAQIDTGLVHAAVSKLHLVSLGAGRKCQQLTDEFSRRCTPSENHTQELDMRQCTAVHRIGKQSQNHIQVVTQG